MTARATAAVLLVALGGATALAVSGSRADPPTTAGLATVYRTVTEHTATRYQGRSIRWWAHRTAVARRQANARALALRRLRAHVRTRWEPTVDYALRLASSVFGVSYWKMKSVAFCESTLNPFATNGRYLGLFQLGWSPYGMSPFDPVASALSTAQTVVHDGGWRQWECG